MQDDQTAADRVGLERSSARRRCIAKRLRQALPEVFPFRQRPAIRRLRAWNPYSFEADSRLYGNSACVGGNEERDSAGAKRRQFCLGRPGWGTSLFLPVSRDG